MTQKTISRFVMPKPRYSTYALSKEELSQLVESWLMDEKGVSATCDVLIFNGSSATISFRKKEMKSILKAMEMEDDAGLEEYVLRDLLNCPRGDLEIRYDEHSSRILIHTENKC